MEKINIPVVPGYHGEDQSNERLIEEAKKMG
jgi:acetyl/propionyl-CoA carboxylase alpha subunit